MRHLSLLEGRPLRRCSKQVGIAFSYGRTRMSSATRARPFGPGLGLNSSFRAGPGPTYRGAIEPRSPPGGS
jgi:hypothetical protein